MHSDTPLRHSLFIRIRSRLFHTYFRFARGLTMGVQGCVLDEQNRVFLVRHTYIPGWHFPGGGLEVGENTLETLHRELKEEGNLVLGGQPTLHGIFYNPRTSKRDHVVLYVVRSFTQTAPRAPDREIAEAGFFALDRLPPDLHPSTRRRLEEIIQQTIPPFVW